VHGILPLKDYAMDAEQMRRIVQLNCQLLSDVPYVEKGTATPGLASNHDGCGQDISDRCGRPKEHSFQADEESLFLDHIYSSSYCTLPKQYLTSFAVKRDFFRAFFGSKEDDLDQQSLTRVHQENYAQHQDENVAMSNSEVQPVVDRLPTSLDVALAGEDVVVEQDGLGDGLDPDHAVDPITSPRESILPQPVSVSPALPASPILPASPVSPASPLFTSPASPLVVSPVSPASSKPSIGSPQTSLVPYVPSAIANQPEPPLHMAQQQRGEESLSFAQASRFLFRRQSGRMLVVLSPTGDNRFRKHHADARSVVSVMNALGLPSEPSFIVQDNGKRMKMTTPITIWEEARLQRLQAVVAVPQNNVTALIRRFETYKDPDEEL